LPEILGMSDRIAVMAGGTIVKILDREEATQDAILSIALGHFENGKGNGKAAVN
jgi:ABC-type sugar transport system ATPase subunit